MQNSLGTNFCPDQTKNGQMGALWSLLLKGKVSQCLCYKFPLQILVISFSFWAELTNFDKIFGFGMQNSYTKDMDIRTCGQSQPGKAPVTLESQK